MTPTKKLWTRIGAGLIVAAFASAAIAADSGTSQTAARVIDAFTGGSNPAIVASMRSDLESRASAKGVISAAQGLMKAGTPGTVGTIGTRPGWGCGDKNHVHTGPPGRPAGAESPCDKNKNR